MKKTVTGIIVGLTLTVAGCASQQVQTPEFLNTYSELPAENALSRQVMYQYLLGKIASLHAGIENQKSDADEAALRQYMEIAVPNLLSAANHMQDADLAALAASAASHIERYDSSFEAARRWVELSPDDPQAHQYAVVAALKTGNTEDSFTHLAYIVELSGDVDDGLLDTAIVLSREGDKAMALELIDRLVAEYGEANYPEYIKATVNANFDEDEKALSLLDVSLEKHPGHMESLLLKSRIYQKLDQPQKATALLKEAVEQDPENQRLRRAYGGQLIGERRYADAREQYAILFEQNPQDVDLAYRLGMLTLELRQLDQADNYFMHVLRSGRRTYEALYYLGRTAELEGNYAAALQNYTRVVEGEFRLEALLREAKMLSELGRTEEGLEALDVLQQNNQDPGLDIRFYLAKADLLVDEQEYQRAYDLLNDGLNKYPEEFDLLYTRSMVAERLERLDEAITDLRGLLGQHPDNPDLMNALGYTLANRTEQYDEAYDLISKALQLKPDSPAIMDSMGWVLYRLGRYEESQNFLQKAYDIDPDPEIAAHLGELLWKLGEQQKANVIWQKALEKAPEHEVLKSVINQFK